MTESKVSTLKSMKEDGWVLTTINGVKCLKLVEDNYTMIAERNNDGVMSPDNLLSIVDKLGKPHRIHTINGSITTLEY